MNKKLSNFFWGLILIAGGAAALAQTQGYLTDLQPVIWVTVFAVISLVSLIFYFLSGIQNWAMLFPVGIFGALAFLINQAVNHADNPALAAPLFAGIGLFGLYTKRLYPEEGEDLILYTISGACFLFTGAALFTPPIFFRMLRLMLP